MTPANERQIDETERLHNLLQTLSLTFHGLSHDLREPIRTLLCYSEILGKNAAVRSDPNASECVHFIAGAAQRMDVLITGLLDYSRLLGDVPRPHTTVDMNLTVQTALANLHLIIEESAASVVYDALPSVIGDPVQLTELTQNLLANSIKYRSAEPPQIMISSRPLGKEHVFSIRDNGIGIDPKYYNSIFMPFTRLHGQDVAGAGLGLTICQRIVEVHSGKLWVESTPGKGSTFHFSLTAANN